MWHDLKTAALLGLLAVLAPGSLASGRAQELTGPEVKKVRPPCPTEVAIEEKDGVVTIRWRPSVLETIVGYRVYRQVDGKFEKIGDPEKPPFLDRNPPHGAACYALTSVSFRSGESAMTTPVPKPGTPRGSCASEKH
jgi:hypothetical protein